MVHDLELIHIKEENKYLIKKESIYFSISEVVFLIIQKKQLDWTLSEIAIFLNKEKDTTFYNEELINEILLDERLKSIFTQEKVSVSKTNYIYFKIKLIDPNKIKNTLNFLSVYLFQKTMISSVLIIGTLSTILYLSFFYNNIIDIKTKLNNNIIDQIPLLLFIYIAYVLIIFIHEIGHSSAAYKFGVVPKQIGFGFYFTMPVLFTELTDIWRLKRNDKILINISGLYFQFIINILIITALLIHPKNPILNVLFLTNSFSIFFALNPFFKNDGYWVFSDYFNIANLEVKADKCFIQLFRFLTSPRKALHFFSDKRSILIFYSFINFLFWFYFLFKTTKYMIINAEQHYQSLLKGFDIMTVGKILLYLFFVYMFSKSIYNRIKSIILN